MTQTDAPRLRELLALFLLSTVLLAYEIWLTRLIAIQHWYHLAHLVIAIALLGFGCAGVVVTLRADSVLRRSQPWLFLPAILVGLFVTVSTLLTTLLPLNMLALPWQFGQMAWLGLYALTLLPAFLCGALFISVCFVRWPYYAGRVYAADLLGGACGALLILPMIRAIGLEHSLLLIACVALAAALLLVQARRRDRLCCAVALLVITGCYSLIEIRVAPYKPLSSRLLERDSQLILEQDSYAKRFSVVSSPGMHAAPGLSLGSDFSAPRQWQLFADGESSALLLLPPEPSKTFYPQLLAYAPYPLIRSEPRVLVLGADAMWHGWIAHGLQTRHLSLTSADRSTSTLFKQLKSRQPKGIYPDSLEWIHSSERRFLRASSGSYDLIVIDVPSPQAGMAAAQENYLLTRQGIGDALDRLEPGGVLALFVHMHSLPRDTLKAAALLHSSLTTRGLRATEHVAVLRDWRTAVLMASSTPLTRLQLSQLRAWAEQWQFDLVALPGLREEESNRFHSRQYGYFQPLQSILAGQPLQRPLFDTTPSSDDRPFFFRFFRWQSLPDLLETTGSLWRQHMEWGYLLGLVTLVLGGGLAAILLAVPLLHHGRTERPPHPLLLTAYFGGIGLGFMLAEITLLQRASLLLDATAISLSIVLAAMLAGASLGSWCQHRWQPRTSWLALLFGLILVFTLSALPLLDQLFALTASWPTPGRAAVAITLILAIGIPMGFPLPHALYCLRHQAASSIAWAWAANGFASVLGSLMASLIAMHWGLSAVMLMAALCYATAAGLLPLLSRHFEH